MQFLDPASMSEALQQALEVQSGLPRDRALQCARIFESLRGEAVQEQGATEQHRAIEVAPEAAEAIRQRVDEIVEAHVRFLHDWSPGVDQAPGYEAFENAFRNFSASEIGVRAMFAIVRSVEIDDLGTLRIVPKRFDTSISDGQAVVGDEMTEAERLVARTQWIINHVRDVDYRGLSTTERAQIDTVAGMDEKDLSDDLVLALEHLLLKSEPNYALWISKEGLATLSADCLDKARRAQMRLLAVKDRLHVDDADFLTELAGRADEDVNERTVARVLKLAAQTFAPPGGA